MGWFYFYGTGYLLTLCLFWYLYYLDVEYFSYYLSYISVCSLGTEVVKPYTPVLPFLSLDFQEPAPHDGVHIYLMIKIYSHGLFTQALDHLQIGKYMLGGCVWFCNNCIIFKDSLWVLWHSYCLPTSPGLKTSFSPSSPFSECKGLSSLELGVTHYKKLSPEWCTWTVSHITVDGFEVICSENNFLYFSRRK